MDFIDISLTQFSTCYWAVSSREKEGQAREIESGRARAKKISQRSSSTTVAASKRAKRWKCATTNTVCPHKKITHNWIYGYFTYIHKQSTNCKRRSKRKCARSRIFDVFSWSSSSFIQVSLIQICDHWLVPYNCATAQKMECISLSIYVYAYTVVTWILKLRLDDYVRIYCVLRYEVGQRRKRGGRGHFIQIILVNNFRFISSRLLVHFQSSSSSSIVVVVVVVSVSADFKPHLMI